MGNQSTQTKTSPTTTANKSTQTEPGNDGNVQASVIAMLTGLDSILDMKPSRSPSPEEHQRLNELLSNCFLLREVLESRKRTLPEEELTGLLTTILEQSPDGKPLAKRQKPERQEEESSGQSLSNMRDINEK
ncbi:uncharacterized protein LOC6726517 [Drosophila simulans]|uniref:uncharacterized protein LOC6726517 n=1 Tax=Drosophila simulans TaxID=7240 RepID=UPI00192CF296|nr:uncharacterized protein LOC6726517 [Drosophila simulans]